MNVHPMIAALRKHKAGVVLIALQIAVTLAIVCNAIFIIYARVENVRRPTGLDENNLFLVTQQWVGAPSGDDPAGVQKLDVMLREDLNTLRALPDVESVTPTNSIPLLQSSWNGAVALKPGAELRSGNARTTYYFGDEQWLKTLGVRLVAGRDFTAADVTNMDFRNNTQPSIVIVSRALADKLFPQGNPIGKVIYLNGDSKPSTIVGEVDRLQVPSVSSWASAFVWNSLVAPVRLDGNFSRYAVRAKPGRLEAAMRSAAPALYAANPMRVLDDDDGVQSFKDIRAEAYRADIGMAALMGAVCLILLAVTAAGIVGLTSFWVGQRHRQIGVRRALGARKIDILRYFQIENLMIAGAGAVFGVAMAVGLNRLLMSKFEMQSMPVYYVLIGLAVVVVLGQAAVFVPARRASNVPPVVATRSV